MKKDTESENQSLLNNNRRSSGATKKREANEIAVMVGEMKG